MKPNFQGLYWPNGGIFFGRHGQQVRIILDEYSFRGLRQHCVCFSTHVSSKNLIKLAPTRIAPRQDPQDFEQDMKSKTCIDSLHFCPKQYSVSQENSLSTEQSMARYAALPIKHPEVVLLPQAAVMKELVAQVECTRAPEK